MPPEFQGSSANSSDNSQGQQGGGESQVDVGALLENFKEQMQAPINQGARELQDLKQKGQQTQETLDRIKKALGGGEADADAPDEHDQKIMTYQGQIDQYIAAAIEAERQGRPIPLTVNSAIQSLQGLIEQVKENKQLKSEMAKMKGAVDRVSNPNHQIDMQAYSNIDSNVINALNTVFGEGDEMSDVKQAQFAAVSKLLTKEVKAMQATDPDLWDRIRRNPVDQKKMVKHFVEQVIPPRARALLEEDQIRRTPVTLDDLKQAWGQAKRIEDPNARKEVLDRLRPQLLEHVYARSRGQRDQPQRTRVNDLF